MTTVRSASGPVECTTVLNAAAGSVHGEPGVDDANTKNAGLQNAGTTKYRKRGMWQAAVAQMQRCQGERIKVCKDFSKKTSNNSRLARAVQYY